MSTNGYTDKESVVCTHSVILFGCKKESLHYQTAWKALEDTMLGELSQSQRTSSARFCLREGSKLDS